MHELVNTIIGDDMIKRIYHLIVDAKIPTMAGALAFFLFVNGGSYLFLFVTLSMYLPFDLNIIINEGISDGLLRDFLLYLVNHSANLNYSIFLILTSIYSSSSLYYHFMHIGEQLSKTPQEHKISKRVRALALVFLFLVLISLIIISMSLIGSLLSIPYRTVLIISIIGILFIMLYIGNVLIFHTNKKIIKGVLFSLAYVVIFTILFVVYLSYFSNLKVVYGVFSSIIVFMFYIYILCIGVLLGIYVNSKNLDVFRLLLGK